MHVRALVGATRPSAGMDPVALLEIRRLDTRPVGVRTPTSQPGQV